MNKRERGGGLCGRSVEGIEMDRLLSKSVMMSCSPFLVIPAFLILGLWCAHDRDKSLWNEHYTEGRLERERGGGEERERERYKALLVSGVVLVIVNYELGSSHYHLSR